MSRVLRVLFLTLEYSAGTFSGTGIYAKDQVRSLASLGHQIFVISAKPLNYNQPADYSGATKLYEIPVSRWGKLDLESSWEEYASGVETLLFQEVVSFNPEVVVGVDWSSFPLYKNLKNMYLAENNIPAPFVWSSYRVFTRTMDESSLPIMKKMESECFEEAETSIVLAQSDFNFLVENFVKSSTLKRPHIVFPHLRDGILNIPMLNSVEDTSNGYQLNCRNPRRPYITCCVRLSEEKEPNRFIDIVEEMKKRDLISRFSLVPLLCGSAQTPYAQGLKTRLRRIVPESVMIEEFLGPEKITEIFSQTRLNVHPSLYDAYAMTIVEAASQVKEAPSLVHAGGNVGAADFLKSENSEIFETDFTAGIPAVVDFIEKLLRTEKELEFYGKLACIRARGYTATDNAQEVQKILKQVVDQHYINLSNQSAVSLQQKNKNSHSFSTQCVL